MEVRDFGARLRELRTDAGISLRQFAKRIGKSPTYVSQIENGARWHGKLPPHDDLVAIAKGLDVSLNFLLNVQTVSEMTIGEHEEERKETERRVRETASLAEIGRGVLQLIEGRGNLTGRATVRASATVSRAVPVVNGISASDVASGVRQVEQLIEVPTWMLNGATDPVAFVIVGDCLQERWGIRTGDTLIVDAANTDPRDGQVVAARINDQDETAKEFHRVPGGVDLRPTSPGYDAIEIRGNDQLVIIGVYVTHLVTGKR